MASVGSLLSEEQLQCSICLDVFADPITTPCGHNYCKACITHYWGNTILCRCPLCTNVFHNRPEVRVNTLLSEIADQFRKSQQRPAAEPDEVSCDICSETVKLKALKSCLACHISFCETHLEPHHRVTALKQHKLINPVKNLDEFMCKKHGRPLELFCRTDDMFVCHFCTESDHRLHQVVSLEEECEVKKAVLRKTEAEVQQMIQERLVWIQEVKNHKTKENQAEGLIKELEKEIVELKKKSSDLKQLSHTEDHLHLLQKFTSINNPPPTKKSFSQQMDKLYEAELRRVQQYAMDVTLDPDSAHCELTLSDHGKQVHHGGVWTYLPDSTRRFFRHLCVLGKESISSGRFYYEVQVKGKTEWFLGVVRESIKSSGFRCFVPSVKKNRQQIKLRPSKGYWTIALRNVIEYMANADTAVPIPVRQLVQTVGVFVDYEEGLVSFYDVEARVHLYSFTGCTFTERLYPYFSPSLSYNGKNSSSLIISPVNHTGEQPERCLSMFPLQPQILTHNYNTRGRSRPDSAQTTG